MRQILFFDLPVLTKANKANYRQFVKTIKKNGFYMLQYSVYVKMNMDQRASEACSKFINNVAPPDGCIFILTVTEKQFVAMEIILGESKTEVVNSFDRVISL